MYIEVFTESDLKFLKPLEPEGWGDLIPRFSFFLRHDFIFPFKMILDGHIVALGATIVLRNSAWLACIITHPQFRNRGLGEKMTRHLIDSVDRLKIDSVNLIATEAGFPLYKKMGFVTDSIYEHFYSVFDVSAIRVDEHIRQATLNDLNEIIALDTKFSCEDRSPLMTSYLEDAYVFRQRSELKGYYYPGLGEGNIVATEENAGFALMMYRAVTKKNAVIPVRNGYAINFMKEAGFTPFRISTRMYIGKPLAWQPEQLFNRISGQLG